MRKAPAILALLALVFALIGLFPPRLDALTPNFLRFFFRTNTTSGFVFPTRPPIPTTPSLNYVMPTPITIPDGGLTTPTPSGPSLIVSSAPVQVVASVTVTPAPVQPTSTPQPTITSTRTPTPTTRPTSIPTYLRTSPPPNSTVSGDGVRDYIMGEINDYRRQNGLGNLSTEQYTCSFATLRAGEIVNNFNHDGFRNRLDNKTLPYPSYTLVNENIAMTSNYQQVADMWINSSGHAANLRADMPHGCVGKNGNYYAFLGWRP